MKYFDEIWNYVEWYLPDSGALSIERDLNFAVSLLLCVCCSDQLDHEICGCCTILL